MRWANRMGAALLFALLLAAGVALMGVAASRAWWTAVEAFAARAGRVYAFAAGLGMASLALLLAACEARRSRRERTLSFRNSDGLVSIGTAAICDYIRRLAPEFPSIVAMTPRVAPRRRTVDVIVAVRVKPSPQIHEICEVLQRRVREVMATGLGIQEVGRVEVSVRQISGEHKPA